LKDTKKPRRAEKKPAQKTLKQRRVEKRAAAASPNRSLDLR
jgi:hypothetical protein